jgi:hypothetical protein
MKEKRHTVIVNQVGQTITGRLVSETDTTITLHNPVILFVEMEQNGAYKFQPVPLLLFEFINPSDREQNNWTYHKSSIAISDVVLDPRMADLVDKINAPRVQAEPQAVPSSSPKIVSIDSL